MRQWVVLLPQPAPSAIIPTTLHLAPSSPMTVVAMPASNASAIARLNHNLAGCDRHTAAHPAWQCDYGLTHSQRHVRGQMRFKTEQRAIAALAAFTHQRQVSPDRRIGGCEVD